MLTSVVSRMTDGYCGQLRPYNLLGHDRNRHIQCTVATVWEVL